MWQKNYKGKKFVGRYIRDKKGERTVVLIAYKTNGQIHTVSAESFEMLKKAGWKKV